MKTEGKHPFGELLTQYRARKPGLTQTRLAELAGYDQAILVRMGQGKKDLTGPSGRDRVISIISILRDEGVLTSLDEANALLAAAQMPPLYEGLPVERALIRSLKPSAVPSSGALVATPAEISQPWRYRLPARWTSFVGRDEEISEIRRLLKRARLITLTGAGGSGKTRLALEAAASLAASFASGACFVSLAPLSDPDQVPAALAFALQVRETPERSVVEQLQDHLRYKDLLLCIDNFEHVLPAATIVTGLLAAADHLKFIVTSREALRLYGEHEVVVEPLALEAAMELFVERARAVKRDFELTSANADSIEGICRRLDCLPLAIELAAAQIKRFTPPSLLERLTVTLLTDGPRDMPARQQTLKNTIDWSYDLLSEPEKTVFRRLGVFMGGWELEQAEEVASDELRIENEESRKPDGVSFLNSQFAILNSDVLSLLTHLVSKSLVIVEERDETIRYHQLETIREYALERLCECRELDGVTRRHADAFAAFAEQAYLGVQGSSQRQWLARLEREHANLSAALHWSFDRGGDSIFGCRIVSALQLPWRNTTSHQHDIWRWAHQASDALTDDMPARVHGGIWLGRTLVKMGLSTPEALPRLEKALAYYKAAEDSYGIADAQGQVGLALQLTGQDDPLGLRMLEEAIALSKSLGNTLIEHRLLKDLAFLFQSRGGFERANALRLEAIDSCRRGGDLVNLTMLLYEHANQFLELMRFEEALRYGEEAAQMAQEINDPRSEMNARGIVTEVIRYLGDAPRAVALNEDLLVFSRERLAPLDLWLPILLTAKSLNDAGNHQRAQLLLDELTTLLNATLGATHGYYGHVFDAVACVASSRGNARRSARLFGTADAEMAASNERRFKNNDMEIAPYIAKARAALGDEVYEAAYAEGRAMTLEQAIAYALNEKEWNSSEESHSRDLFVSDTWQDASASNPT